VRSTVADRVLALAHELRQRSEPFALATVVRCERPTSAKPGAKAIVQPDGRLTGWVGGACAEPTVVREALAALQDGEPRLLRLVGEGGSSRAPSEGVVEHAMTCHSGGTLEIYVEPHLPDPRLVLIGQGPVLETLARLGPVVGFTVVSLGGEASAEELARLGSRSAVVVATHGRFDEDALEHVLAGDAGFVSLVASRRRANAIVETLRRRGVPVDRLGRLKAPAGLDIGAVAPEEIAVSILAEIIQARRSPKPGPPGEDAGAAHPEPTGSAEATAASVGVAATPPARARDPVCGMLVDIVSARYRSVVSGQAVYFCCLTCEETFDHDRHPGGSAPGTR
jgi:xanthine dehydrogenase accessory factor